MSRRLPVNRVAEQQEQSQRIKKKLFVLCTLFLGHCVRIGMCAAQTKFDVRFMVAYDDVDVNNDDDNDGVRTVRVYTTLTVCSTYNTHTHTPTMIPFN